MAGQMLRLLGVLLLVSGVSASCKCLTRPGVNITYTACSGRVITTLGGTPCFSDLGGRQRCIHGNAYYDWVQVDYDGTAGWVADTHLNDGSEDKCHAPRADGVGCPGVNIVSRSQWGARAPKSITRFRSTPVTAFIHHSAGPRCTSQKACSAIVHGIQAYHMDTKGWDDIGYNFLVGEDGQAYEGRGWDHVGAQAKGFNSRSLGFCMLGNFMSVTPNQAALTAVQNLIRCGVNMGKLSKGSWIAGHRDCVQTECPGNALYKVIQGWPGYKKQCPRE